MIILTIASRKEEGKPLLNVWSIFYKKIGNYNMLFMAHNAVVEQMNPLLTIL